MLLLAYTKKGENTGRMNDRNIPRNTLHLNLKSKWFDMILSGEKKEEYRDIKPYWHRFFRFYTGRCGDIFPVGKLLFVIKSRYYFPERSVICFSNGYSKNRRQMYVECSGLKIDYGKSEWGAADNIIYFVIQLGNIIQTVNCTVSTRRANANP